MRLALIFALVIVGLPVPVHAEGAVRGVVHRRFIALLNPVTLLAPSFDHPLGLVPRRRRSSVTPSYFDGKLGWKNSARRLSDR